MKTDKLDKLLLSLPGWLFTVAVVLAVLYLTLFPDPVPEMDIELFPGVDKVVHAIMMLGVYLCISLDLMRHDHKAMHRLSLRTCALIFVITSAFGGAIELIQAAMNMGRGCEITDFWADMAGAMAGWIIVKLTPWPYQRPDANHRPANHG